MRVLQTRSATSRLHATAHLALRFVTLNCLSMRLVRFQAALENVIPRPNAVCCVCSILRVLCVLAAGASACD